MICKRPLLCGYSVIVNAFFLQFEHNYFASFFFCSYLCYYCLFLHFSSLLCFCSKM